jgi:hypothetical protein
MEKIKNPSNKNSIPSIIISDYDANKINEIKVKYIKLARLDKITIQDMNIIDNKIVFNKILFNGLSYPLHDNTKIEFDNYEITGKIQTSRKRITIERDGKEKIFFENEGFTFEYKDSDIKINEIQTKAKYILTIKDKNLRDSEKEQRVKTTERELPYDKLLDTYKQISGFDTLTSKDIYKIKRYIDFKNEMMFYFQFIEEFFNPLLPKNQNFYGLNIEQNRNIAKLIIYRLNDDFKNQSLKSYIQNEGTIKSDFQKIQKILSDFRHSLVHFDFDFIQKFFDNQLDKIKFDISTISLIKTLLQQKEEKNYQEKNNYIDDIDTLTIFDEKESKFSKLHNFYTKISHKKPAFNKLINSFLSKDGISNEEFKSYLHEKKLDFFEDIHASKEYKKIYIEHKNLVIQKQKEEALEKPDGQKLKTINDELQILKEKMNAITKVNSLNRLEVKLRLAFGFIANEYNYNFKKFNENFTLDVKNAIKIQEYKNSSNEKLKIYFESTFKEKSFFHFNVKFFNKITKKEETKEKDIFNLIENETLEELVKDSTLLQIITLLYLFVPKELQGEFVGFILKIYHHTKNISTDTKEDETSIEDAQNSFSLKLKILAKNLRGLQLFNYCLSHNTLYNIKEHFFYEKGNRWQSIYKDLQISHNQDEFDAHLVIPIIKYYINLYKLIGDFEIYALLKYANKKNITDNLSKLTELEDLKFNNHYNFTTLLNRVFGIDINYKSNPPFIQYIKQIRNNISHQDIKKMIESFEHNEVFLQRENIIQYLKTEHLMQDILHFNPINDFTMKTVQYLKSLSVHSQKEGKIADINKKESLVPNDYYLIYKLKAIELLKQKVIEVIGELQEENKIKNAIANEEKIKDILANQVNINSSYKIIENSKKNR